jgi:ATP synthase protein I
VPDEPPRPRAKGPASAYASGMAEAGPYLTVGIQVAGGMVMFVIGGYFADRWLGTSPWLLLLGAVFGAVAAFYTLLRLVRQLEAREAARKRNAPPR